MSLNVKKLEAIKATGQRFEVPDSDGLSVRVSPTGKKIFQYRYRFGGKQSRHDYGVFPEMKLSDARLEHQKFKSNLSKGLSPKSSSGNLKTVGDLFDEWNKKYNQIARRAPAAAEQMITADIKPAIGHIKISAIKKSHFITLFDDIIARGSKTQANRVRALCKQVMSWSKTRDYILIDPISDVTAKTIAYKEKKRDRFLSDSEIGIVWNLLDIANMSPSTVNALKVLLLSGTRRAEPYKAKWKHIDFDKREWLIPAENNKTESANTVMMSDELLNVFKQQKQVVIMMGGSDWVFPALNDPDKHLDPNSVTRAVARHCKKGFWVDDDENPIPNWTPHALRHTFETKLTEIGIEYVVLKRLTNHNVGNMSDTYNHAELKDKKLDAMQRWSKKILECAHV